MSNLQFGRLLVIVVSLVFAHTTLAQSLDSTLVISDIDDTIQLTQVRPASRTLTSRANHLKNLAMNVTKAHDAFIGLPNLYQNLADSGAKFVYVTGAPQAIWFLPTRFLESAGFPVGELVLRPSKQPTEAYKVDAISAQILAHPTARVILIGDDGEHDVDVYARLKNDSRFGSRIASVYIHTLYNDDIGRPLAEAQRP